MADTMEETVAAVVEITGQFSDEHRAMVHRALRSRHENDPDSRIAAVINEFFEDANAFSRKYAENNYTYDPSAFLANRDGSLPSSFNVQGPDEPAANGNTWQNGNGLSAPSRPPSRAQNRSPLGKMTDWATENILEPPRTQAEADEELARGIEASMKQTSGGVAPQESGITVNQNELISHPTSETHFGPAMRPSYDENWAMVPVNAKSFDPPPSQRLRNSKVPVFLACRLEQANKHRLGPLMMILHEIPAARNFFLLLEGSSQSYGNHKEWWRGQQILTKSQAPESWANNYQDVSLVDETQRLIAFLDQTDRTYGTADSLCETHMIKSAWGDQVLRFYEALYNCSNSQELTRMWTSVKVDYTSGDSRPQEFAILDFRISNDTPEVLCNLYSQWDYLFWIQQENGWDGWAGRQDQTLSQIASIQIPAQVMTMRIRTDGLPIEIPEVLYIDRYLEGNLETARGMQNKMFQMWKAIDAAREKEVELSQWKNPDTGSAVDKTALAKRVIERSEDQIWQIRAKALWRMHEDSIGTDDQLPYLPDELNHIAQLNEDEHKALKHFEAQIDLAKLRLTKIDRKLARIRAEKEACCALLRELKKTLTVPNDDPALNPTHKYTLRGVITSPDVLYLCVRKREPLENGDGGVDQWYRIAWVSDDPNPVQQEKTTIENVKEAMFTEVDSDGNKAPIFVYATDEALNDHPEYLSSALQTFVKFDNRLFGQELREEPPPRDRKRVAMRSPQSPPKRQRSDSADSMATNRASSGGFSDSEERAALLAEQFEDPFGGDEMMEMEMADMRPISQDEIAAHMVPPTPPLSADGASDQDSLGLHRSAEKLANFSLNDDDAPGEEQDKGKSPEMEELKAPFIVRRPASAVDSRASIMEKPMEIDTKLEIPGVNPEEYYHQTC